MVTVVRRLSAAMLVAVLVCAGSLLGAGASGAVTPAPPSVSIVNPVSGSTVSGQIAFTVAIDQIDAAHPVTQVDFQVYGATQGQQEKIVDVAPGECAATCEISASFDTATLVVPTNPDPAQPSRNQNLSDGSAEFAAAVYTSFGPTGFASGHFTIDNRRPALSLPDLPITPGTGAQVPGAATLS